MRYTALLIAAFLCMPLCRAQQPATPTAQQATETTPQFPTLRVNASIVQVPVLVLYPTHDKVVTTITPDRFSISFDRGPFVKPAGVRMEGDDPIDLAIVLDARGAQNSLLPTLDQAIANLAPTQLHPQDHVSIYAMTCGSIRTVTNVPADPARLKTAVDSALTDWTARRAGKDKSPCSASAPVWDLMAYAADGLSKAPDRRVILAFTNGGDKQSTHTWDFVYTYAQTLGVTIFALNADTGTTHLNYDPHDMVVSALSSALSTSNRREPVFRLPDVCELSGGVELRIDRNDPVPTLMRAIEMIRDRYVVDFPLDLAKPGYHDLQVSIDRDNFFIRPAGNGVPVVNPGQTGAPAVTPPPTPQLAESAIPQQPATQPLPAPQPLAVTPPTPVALQPAAATPPQTIPTIEAMNSQAAQEKQPAVSTLHATARLVYVDVVVHDKNGQPVHGLKAEDFALLESGKSQTFQEFQEHTAPTAEEVARVPQLTKLSEGTFSNFASAATPKIDGPLNVLLLDKLNTSGADQKNMKKQIDDYLQHAPAGQRMAIFGLTGHLVMLQGFTTDTAAIHKAVNDTHGQQGTSLLSPPVDLLFSTNGMAAGSPDDDSDSSRGPTAAMGSGDQMLSANQVQLRAITTLHAMDELARYLATLPGRKNLVWFSGSFPVEVPPSMAGEAPGSPLLATPQPGGMADNPFENVKSEQKGFEQTSALLSRAQVAVYPIDVKGLKVASIFDASDGGHSPAINSQLISDFDDHNYGEHATMLDLADGTGGKAFLNTNDFSAAMGKALDDGANYYTIAYAPTDSKWDGKFRQIEVKLRQKGDSLSYRKGYFAQEVKDPSGSKPMQLALLHGGPEPTQILFSTKVQPVNALTESIAAPDNRPGQNVKGPYRRFQVEFSVDAKSLQFTQKDAAHQHLSLEFMAYVYGAEGEPVNTVGRSMQLDVPAEAYAQFVKSGVPFKVDVSVPAHGNYSLRMAVHDTSNDHVGAVELPVASVSGLQSLEASK